MTAGDITIDGEAAPEDLGTGIFAGAEGAGHAGTIVVSARNDLTIVNGGQIRGSTLSRGNAGSVEVHADTITIDGAGSQIASQAVGPGFTANAGAVDVTARDQIIISGGGQITSSTFGRGPAGSVTVNAGDLVIDASGTSGQSLTGITSQSEGLGRAGGVLVEADRIELRDGGGIQAVSLDEEGGPAGAVTVRASDRLVMDGGAISTQSEAAGGGEIQIRVGDVIDLQDSEISTSVGGGTDPTAGNILIDPKALVIDGSRIQANAPVGFGGTVTIVADNIVVPGGDFDALLDRGDISASGGDPTRDGTVAVNAPEINLAGDLVVLETPLLDAAALLGEPCGARRDVGASSLIAAGRGGLPASPDAPLTSVYRGAAPQARLDGGAISPVATQLSMLHIAGCAGAP